MEAQGGENEGGNTGGKIRKVTGGNTGGKAGGSTGGSGGSPDDKKKTTEDMWKRAETMRKTYCTLLGTCRTLIGMVESGEKCLQILNSEDGIGSLKSMATHAESLITPWGQEYLITETKDMKAATPEDQVAGQLANFLCANDAIMTLGKEHRRLMAVCTASKKAK